MYSKATFLARKISHDHQLTLGYQGQVGMACYQATIVADWYCKDTNRTFSA